MFNKMLHYRLPRAYGIVLLSEIQLLSSLLNFILSILKLAGNMFIYLPAGGATIDKNMTTTMETQKLVKGQKATLTCKAYGFPLPKIVFTKDGKELAGAKQGGSNEQSIAMSLEYSVKNSSDFGTVVCTASNIFGNESHDIKVEEIGKALFF